MKPLTVLFIVVIVAVIAGYLFVTYGPSRMGRTGRSGYDTDGSRICEYRTAYGPTWGDCPGSQSGKARPLAVTPRSMTGGGKQ